VDLVIQNSRIGHSLVPEQRDFYECWVEFVAQDQSGHVLFHSGALDSSGFLDANAHSYTNRLIGKSGNRLGHHEVWQTRLKPYDNTIMPGRSDLARYGFRIPANVRGTIQLLAKVNYRRFRKELHGFYSEELRAVSGSRTGICQFQFTSKEERSISGRERTARAFTLEQLWHCSAGSAAVVEGSGSF
jgi:hypothetical protein